MEILTQHLGKGLFLILMLSLPAVLTAAAVGLVVGILQAVTQVQEQTISAAPKIILVFLLIIFGGGMMMSLVTNYIREAAVLAFDEIPAAGTRILPPQETDEKRKRIERFYAQQVGLPIKSRTKDLMEAPSMGGEGGSLKRNSQINTGFQNKPGTSLSEEMHLQQNRR